MEHHALAFLVRGFPKGTRHRARDLVAEDPRCGQEALLDLLDVGSANAAGVDPHQHLARACFGNGQLLHPEIVGAADTAAFMGIGGEGSMGPRTCCYHPPGGAMREKAGRVLVVDDDEAVGCLVAEVLTAEGFEVTRFETADEALRHEAPGFDAAVLDLVLPAEAVSSSSMPCAGGRPTCRP